MVRCPRIEMVEDRLFEGEEAVLHVIERIVAPLDLRVDGSSPWVDARLSDGGLLQTNSLSLCSRPRLLPPVRSLAASSAPALAATLGESRPHGCEQLRQFRDTAIP